MLKIAKKRLLTIALSLCICLVGCTDIHTGKSNNAQVEGVEESNAFSGKCGIKATAKMGKDIIGQPTVTISVKNVSKKAIEAIKFYAVPYDVYGEEITGWTTQKYLYTDDRIKKGASEDITFQFLEDSVKTVKLYVYSVLFKDGTEWGDKDASEAVILKNGAIIKVKKK